MVRLTSDSQIEVCLTDCKVRLTMVRLIRVRLTNHRLTKFRLS